MELKEPQWLPPWLPSFGKALETLSPIKFTGRLSCGSLGFEWYETQWSSVTGTIWWELNCLTLTLVKGMQELLCVQARLV